MYVVQARVMLVVATALAMRVASVLSTSTAPLSLEICFPPPS